MDEYQKKIFGEIFKIFNDMMKLLPEEQKEVFRKRMKPIILTIGIFGV